MKNLKLIICTILIISCCGCKTNAPINNTNILDHISSKNTISNINKDNKEILSAKTLEELQLTPKQMKTIDSMLCGLIEADILYEFDNASQIVPRHLPMYMSYRAYDYFEIQMDDEMSMDINGEQILQILKGDFGISELPFKCDNIKDLTASLQFGNQGFGFGFKKCSQNGNTITVLADMYRTYQEPSTKHLAIYSNYVEYTFEIQNDGSVILKSGKLKNI